MANESLQSTLELPIPEVCPGCETAWEEDTCPRCGLTRADVIGLLQRGCVSYEAARSAALAGDFHAARLHLSAVRNCGIVVLAEHPSVVRLAALCAEPVEISGDSPIEPEPSKIESLATEIPSWLVPLTVGGGVFGLVAFFFSVFAVLLAIAAFVLALLAFLKH